MVSKANTCIARRMHGEQKDRMVSKAKTCIGRRTYGEQSEHMHREHLSHKNKKRIERNVQYLESRQGRHSSRLDAVQSSLYIP